MTGNSDRTLARSADRHALYELAVQQPIQIVELIEHVLGLDPDAPAVLREDFCGTAQLSAMWVRGGARRRAVGVDIDPKIIRYAERRNRKPLGDAAGRLTLRRADVLRSRAAADVIAALNFSHFIYNTRAAMLRYLRHARRCLRPGGMMLLDIYGGPGAMRPCTDTRHHGDFDYLWEQEAYDVLTSQVINHIHFRFPDGSMLRRAFTYRWRLWTLVELRELLEEAGFTEQAVCFESPEGFTDDLDTADLEAWVAYRMAR